jgi:hypothetical protein
MVKECIHQQLLILKVFILPRQTTFHAKSGKREVLYAWEIGGGGGGFNSVKGCYSKIVQMEEVEISVNSNLTSSPSVWKCETTLYTGNSLLGFHYAGSTDVGGHGCTDH